MHSTWNRACADKCSANASSSLLHDVAIVGSKPRANCSWSRGAVNMNQLELIIAKRAEPSPAWLPSERVWITCSTAGRALCHGSSPVRMSVIATITKALYPRAVAKGGCPLGSFKD